MSYEDIPTYTPEERDREELTDRLGRAPTEDELTVKDVAEEEAYKSIQATPSREYVPREVMGPHFKRLAEELDRSPTDSEKELFRDVFTDEVREENIGREMRM